MAPESLKMIVNDEALFARFIEFEMAVAKIYGRWAPSRELLFLVTRRADNQRA
jgi:hypothetical protein